MSEFGSALGQTAAETRKSSGAKPLLDSSRDARLRSRSREKIRYELEGAAKDGVEPNESWDVLQEGRDVLALLRERDYWKNLATGPLTRNSQLWR